MTKANAKRREERIKIIAAGVANLGTASLVAGLVAPIFGGHMEPYSVLAGVAFGIGFHLVASTVLHWVVVDDPTESAE